MDKIGKMIQFKELRSGNNLASVVLKSVKYDQWSGGKTAEFLNEYHVRDNSYFTVYDFDIKLEMMVLMIAVVLFLKRIMMK